MVKSLKISTLYIEVDDSYHYLKNSVSAEKVRNRMVAMHAGKEKNRVIIGKTINSHCQMLCSFCNGTKGNNSQIITVKT